MDSQRINLLVAKLQSARQAYYSGEPSPLSDAEFDQEEEQLRQLDPLHPYFQLVGAQVESSEKIKHQVTMLSLDKAQNFAELERWMQRLQRTGLVTASSTLLVQPKIDGLSASCYYRSGRLIYVASRGDGLIGQDISHISSYVSDIPSRIALGDEIEVRGELYLPKDSSFIDQDTRSLRNSCVGLVKRKEQRQDLRHVRFVAYQCARGRLTRSEGAQIEALGKLGFHTVEFRLFPGVLEVERFFRLYLEQLRQQWRYETDGLVLCLDDSQLFEAIDSHWKVDHHHHYAIALKPPSEQGRTQLRQIDWQVSRQGSLIPVAVFEEILLSGARISRASVHNFQTVAAFDLQPGDTLLVARANDVIPYLLANLSQDTHPPLNGAEIRANLAPTCCPSCQTPLQRQSVHLQCPNLHCPEQVIQRCAYWVKRADMPQVSEQTIRKLFDAGKIQGLHDLYRLKKEDLLPVRGFAELSIDNLLLQIERSRQSSVLEFLTRLGVPLLQRESWQELALLLLLRQLTLGLFDSLTSLIPHPEVLPELELPASATPKLTASHRSSLQKRAKSPIPTAPEQLRLNWPQVNRKVELGLPNFSPKLPDKVLLPSYGLWGDCKKGHDHLLRKYGLLAGCELLANLLPSYGLLSAQQWLDCWQGLPSVQQLNLPATLPQIWLQAPATPLTVKQWHEHCDSALKKSKQELLRAEVIQKLPLEMFLQADPALAYDAVIAKNWLEWKEIPGNILLIKELSGELNLLQPSVTPAVRPLVACTGTGPLPRNALISLLEQHGFSYSATLGKQVQLLLCDHPEGESSKLKQARKWEIPTLSYQEFLAEDFLANPQEYIQRLRVQLKP